MLSNVRGEPYAVGLPHNLSQTPRSELKMPPVGNFAPPPSVGKDNKKRRGGAGSQMTGGAAVVEPSAGTVGQGSKNGNLRGNTSKVSVEQPEPSLRLGIQ